MNTQNLLTNPKAGQLLSHLLFYFLGKEGTRSNPFFLWRWIPSNSLTFISADEIHRASDLLQDITEANKPQNASWAAFLPSCLSVVYYPPVGQPGITSFSHSWALRFNFCKYYSILARRHLSLSSAATLIVASFRLTVPPSTRLCSKYNPFIPCLHAGFSNPFSSTPVIFLKSETQPCCLRLNSQQTSFSVTQNCYNPAILSYVQTQVKWKCMSTEKPVHLITTALSRIVQKWKQTTRPLPGKWINKRWHMGYLVTKNEVLIHATL